MRILAALQRRNLFRVAVAYAIVAWLIIQVAETLFPALHLPDWTVTFVSVLLIIGFPLVLLFAWIYELTPGGVQVAATDGPAPYHTRTTGMRLNYFIMSALVLAVAYLLVDKYVLVNEPEAVALESADTDSPLIETTPAEAPPQPDTLPNSVAVLPFVSMSPDPDDAWFALGLHEEVLNQLVKLSRLNVISRTTMMRYADTEKTPPEIARELKVASVMEGSVRTAGSMLKVTLQLIDPNTDVHLWSETYDGDMSDIGQIFAIQADIAMNVANALAAEFSDEEQARIEARPTESPEAYTLYVEAQGLMARWSRESSNLAIERIDRALELDPDFAEGWFVKNRILTNAIGYMPERSAELVAEADRAMARALELNPDLPMAFMERARLASTRGEWQQIEEIYRQGLALGIDKSQLFYMHRHILGYLGEFRDTAQEWIRLNPLDSVTSFWAMNMYASLGDTAAVLAEYERGKPLFDNYAGGAGHYVAMTTLLSMGDIERAREIYRTYDPDNPVYIAIEKHYDKPEEVLAELHRLFVNAASATDYRLTHIAAWATYFGDQELALKATADEYHIFAATVYKVWHPLYINMRRDPGFKDLVQEMGFVDFWRKYGWPDLCRPVEEDDFECN